MRIGMVTADFWPNVGGVATHVVELGRALARQGHVVHVLTRPLGAARVPRCSLDGMYVHRPNLVQLRPFSDWILQRWLRGFLQREPLDLLHVHGMRPLRAVCGLDRPLVFTNHTSGFLQRIQRGAAARRRVARLIAPAETVLAPSAELADATRQLGLPTPVEYIPNGVDPVRFSPVGSSVRTRLGIAHDEIVILLARRLAAKNGVCVFAESAAKFLRPGVRLLFAGDGPERRRVEAILERSGCRQSALFLGDIPNNEMPTVYRAADVSVLPSFLEATSITGLESMSTGVALVGTRVGGIPALIEHERTGLLVEPGDPVQLAAAIRRLIEAPHLRRVLGAAARERVEQHFSWQAIAARTLDCYQAVLDRRAGRPVRPTPPAAATPSREAA